MAHRTRKEILDDEELEEGRRKPLSIRHVNLDA